MAPRRSNAPTAAGIEKPSVRTMLPAHRIVGAAAARGVGQVEQASAVPPAYFDGT